MMIYNKYGRGERCSYWLARIFIEKENEKTR